MAITPRDVHVDAVLTDFSVGWREGSLIARDVAPMVIVPKQSDLYYVWDQGEELRNEAGLRAPGTMGPEGAPSVSTTPFATRQISFTSFVDSETRDNADSVLRLDLHMTEYATRKVNIAHEADVAGVVFSASSYASGHTVTLSGTSQWSHASSTPMSDIFTGIAKVESATGLTPNVLVLGRAVFHHLRRHAQLTELTKYTQRGVLTEDLIASLFGLERVLVGRAVYNSAAEGAAPSITDIWGKHAALLYVNPRPAIETVSFAYTFVWQPYNFVAERWYDQSGRVYRYRVILSRDIKVVANTAGYLIQDAVA